MYLSIFCFLPFAAWNFRIFWKIIETFYRVDAVAKISACADDLSCPLEVIKCFQLNTYIKTMGLTQFWTHAHRGTKDLDRITPASELLRCGEIAGILTRGLWGKSQTGLSYAPTTGAYTTSLWPVVCDADGCNSTSGRALLLFYLSPGRRKKYTLTFNR